MEIPEILPFLARNTRVFSLPGVGGRREGEEWVLSVVKIAHLLARLELELLAVAVAVGVASPAAAAAAVVAATDEEEGK